MNQKKAKKLRKTLGMTVENHRQKDYSVVKATKKVIWVNSPSGGKVPVEAKMETVVNRNLYFYRKHKKELLRG